MINVKHNIADQLTLVDPVHAPARNIPSHHLTPSDLGEEGLASLVSDLFASEVVAIDFETRGVQWWHPDPSNQSYPVGVGLAWNEGRCYIALDKDNQDEQWLISFLRELSKHQGLIAHNSYFEGGWFNRYTGAQPDWLADTFTLLRFLASEDFFGQQWGLKWCMSHLLGWTDTNDVKLDSWLIHNGWTTQPPPLRKNETAEEHRARIIEHAREKRDTHPEGHEKYPRPAKGEMWRAPQDILGEYCQLDAEATYLLWLRVIKPAMDRDEALTQMWPDLILPWIQRHVVQQARGIRLDLSQLEARLVELDATMNEAEVLIREHEVAGQIILDWESARLKEHTDKEPSEYVKDAYRDIGEEPMRWKTDKQLGIKEWTKATHKKDGTPNAVWLEFKKKQQTIRNAGPQETQAWKHWTQRVKKVEAARAQKSSTWMQWSKKLNDIQTRQAGNNYNFSLGSSSHLKRLIYEDLFDWEWIMEPDKDKNPKGLLRFHGLGEGDKPRTYELEGTDSGALPVDKNTMIACGSIGKIVGKHQKAQKLLSYINSYIKLSVEFEGERRIYPGWKVPASTTGRIGGVAPNMLQIPKCGTTLDAFLPDEGNVFVDNDHCLTPEHQALTETRGWVDILDVRMDDRVWQVDKDTMEGSWVNPVRVISKHYNGGVYTIGNVDGALRVTSQHRMLYVSGASGMISNMRWECLAEDYLPAAGSCLPLVSISIAKPSSLIISRSDLWHGLRDISDNNEGRALHESLVWWDGHTDKDGAITWATDNETDIDKVQSLLTRNGYSARKVLSYPGYRYRRWSLIINSSQTIKVLREQVVPSHYEGMVGCVTVPSGYFLVRRDGQTFVTGNCALENVVLAELSRDPKLLELYGPDAKPHDAYLFNGASLPVIGPSIREHYDTENPTKAMVKEAKIKLHFIRNKICKTMTLSKNYGVGVAKMHRTLLLAGVDITREEVKAIHKAFDVFYSGLGTFKEGLEEEWRINGGWIKNGFGRKIGASERKKKDLVNVTGQSTGHDVHLLYQSICEDLLAEWGGYWQPIIWDFHDQTILECKEEDSAAVAQIIGIDAYVVLNEALGWMCKHVGDPQVARSLGEIKVEDHKMDQE